MRHVLIQFGYLTAMCTLLVACTSQQAPIVHGAFEPNALPLNAVSRLKSEATPADLHRVANDAATPREKRAEAIFSHFANHVKLPQNMSVAGTVLSSANWRKDASLTRVTVVGGHVPVELNFKDAVFCLLLFPDADGWSDWVIYLRLSGGLDLTDDDARVLLGGAEALKGTPKLVEFALCFPLEGEKLRARTERFSEKGITVEEVEYGPMK